MSLKKSNVGTLKFKRKSKCQLNAKGRELWRVAFSWCGKQEEGNSPLHARWRRQCWISTQRAREKAVARMLNQHGFSIFCSQTKCLFSSAFLKLLIESPNLRLLCHNLDLGLFHSKLSYLHSMGNTEDLQGCPPGQKKPPIDLDLGCSTILRGQQIATVADHQLPELSEMKQR